MERIQSYCCSFFFSSRDLKGKKKSKKLKNNNCPKTLKLEMKNKPSKIGRLDHQRDL